jgi:hypothetical protein
MVGIEASVDRSNAKRDVLGLADLLSDRSNFPKIRRRHFMTQFLTRFNADAVTNRSRVRLRCKL